ncbi:M48 family metallopeptidase [Pseudooceanicola sp. C21-150M6]|uniref:M48 family metallopeptidase n=1 Tax=Pseudooceanicola sp. C21-150M6 TaxID=3434355 RepID=UPI003D7F5C68
MFLTFRSIIWLIPACLALAGCDVPTTPLPTPAAGTATATPLPDDAIRQAARRFVTAAERVEPVAERTCRRRTPDLRCDFRIVIDDRPDAPINAFQMRDDAGNPVIAVTVPLIAYVRNVDEMAFILSHEAAHHISRHLDRRRQSTEATSLIFAQIAAASGGNVGVSTAARLGALVGSRTYAKEYELEADALGALIARDAGFDAINGARYFERAPDPGNRFLGTHPPNGDRVEAVRRALAGG